MSNALQRTDELPIAPLGSGSPMELLAVAVNRGADVGTLERLAALAESFDKKRAKQEFDVAMAAFQSECPIILKTVDGAQKKYKFAPLDHIVTQVKPLLEKHGFSYRLTCEMKAGFVKSIMTITHRAGHSEVSELEVPVDTRNPVMSEPQKYGGAVTFANRYNFCNGFGILTANEDNDGQTARSKLSPWLAEKMDKQKSAAQPSPTKTKLWAACKPIRGSEQSWDVAEAWMVRKAILKPGQKVATLTDEEMSEACDKVAIELTGN